MLHDLPAAQTQLTSPSIAFQCSGDESSLWQRGFENRGSANPLFQPRQRLSPAGTGGDPGGQGQPVCPVRVGKTIPLTFRSLWQLLRAPEHVCTGPHFHTGGFSAPPRHAFQDKPSETAEGTGHGLWVHGSHPLLPMPQLWLPCAGGFQDGLLFTYFRFNSLALHLSSPSRGA